MKHILITGGAGYLGLNMAVSFLQKDCDVVIVDNLKNSFEMHVCRLVKEFDGRVKFCQGDVCDKVFMRGVFETYDFDVVIHLAGYKYVSESIKKPQEYFDNNIGSLEVILELAKEFKVKKFAFSSSAVVYGNTKVVPTNESVEFAPMSPYAKTKCVSEDMIGEWCQISGISAVIFRFSNPIGANELFMFGDHSKNGFENLLPYIVRCAIEGKSMVFRGNNHPTPDGTPIRDYIGVVDVANIVSTVLMADQTDKCEVLNVGRGSGFSLLEIVETVEVVLGKKIDYSFGEKSDLEASVSVLDVGKLHSRYDIEVKQSLKEIVESQIKFFEYIRQK